MNEEDVMSEKTEWKCCKNVGAEVFRSCDKPAVFFYRHGDSICSYCEEHNYVCGQRLDQPPEDEA